jgi:hypothetical protein
MSVDELIDTAKSMEASDFETLYRTLSALHIQRHGGPVLPEAEADLLRGINSEFDTDKLERLRYLDWKLEAGALTVSEEVESIELAEAYEHFSVERLKKLVQLANLRQVSLDDLMAQLGLNK